MLKVAAPSPGELALMKPGAVLIGMLNPFAQETLDRMLAELLADPERRAVQGRNGLAFADSADLYSLPERAADVILGVA